MIRNHITYANVTATLALVLATGTGAVYAAGEIGSSELDNNSVRTQDLKDQRGVTGEDLRGNTLGGREISEGSLNGSRIVELEGTQAADCDPQDSVFSDCVSETLDLDASSQVLVTATGGFSSETDGANAECEVRVDGTDQSTSADPGEVLDNTTAIATDGFARTLVTEGLTAGTHTIALACQQLGAEDAWIRSPTIAVVAVSTD